MQFILLTLPLGLLVVASTNFFINLLVDTSFRAQAIAAAKFASFADVTLAEAHAHLSEICAQTTFSLSANCALQFEDNGLVHVSLNYQPLHLMFFQPGRVNIDAFVALETAK